MIEILKESIRNRQVFLEQKKLEFISCDSERKRKKLIVELIQLEPSHLAEDWILDQVIKWMKNRKNNLDYLMAAFISKGIRGEISDKQKEDLFKKFALNQLVEKGAKAEGSKKGAIIKLVVNAKDYKSEQPGEQPKKYVIFSSPEIVFKAKEPEKAIEQELKRYRKILNNRVLPFPYYGKDVVEFDRGNENHRLEIYLYNMPAEANGQKLFGDTVITYHL